MSNVHHHAGGPSIEPAQIEPPIASWTECRALAMVVGVREAARRLGLNEDTACVRSMREGWLKSIAAQKAVQSAHAAKSRPGPAGGSNGKHLKAPANSGASHALAAELAALDARSKLGGARAAALTLEHVARKAKHRPDQVFDKAEKLKALVATAGEIGQWDKRAPAVRMSLDVAGAASVTLEVGGESQRVEIASFDDMTAKSELDGIPLIETVEPDEGQNRG